MEARQRRRMSLGRLQRPAPERNDYEEILGHGNGEKENSVPPTAASSPLRARYRVTLGGSHRSSFRQHPDAFERDHQSSSRGGSRNGTPRTPLAESPSHRFHNEPESPLINESESQQEKFDTAEMFKQPVSESFFQSSKHIFNYPFSSAIEEPPSLARGGASRSRWNSVDEGTERPPPVRSRSKERSTPDPVGRAPSPRLGRRKPPPANLQIPNHRQQQEQLPYDEKQNRREAERERILRLMNGLDALLVDTPKNGPKKPETSPSDSAEVSQQAHATAAQNKGQIQKEQERAAIKNLMKGLDKLLVDTPPAARTNPKTPFQEQPSKTATKMETPEIKARQDSPGLPRTHSRSKSNEFYSVPSKIASLSPSKALESNTSSLTEDTKRNKALMEKQSESSATTALFENKLQTPSTTTKTSEEVLGKDQVPLAMQRKERPPTFEIQKPDPMKCPLLARSIPVINPSPKDSPQIWFNTTDGAEMIPRTTLGSSSPSCGFPTTPNLGMQQAASISIDSTLPSSFSLASASNDVWVRRLSNSNSNKANRVARPPTPTQLLELESQSFLSSKEATFSISNSGCSTSEAESSRKLRQFSSVETSDTTLMSRDSIDSSWAGRARAPWEYRQESQQSSSEGEEVTLLMRSSKSSEQVDLSTMNSGKESQIASVDDGEPSFDGEREQAPRRNQSNGQLSKDQQETRPPLDNTNECSKTQGYIQEVKEIQNNGCSKAQREDVLQEMNIQARIASSKPEEQVQEINVGGEQARIVCPAPEEQVQEVQARNADSKPAEQVKEKNYMKARNIFNAPPRPEHDSTSNNKSHFPTKPDARARPQIDTQTMQQEQTPREQVTKARTEVRVDKVDSEQYKPMTIQERIKAFNQASSSPINGKLQSPKVADRSPSSGWEKGRRGLSPSSLGAHGQDILNRSRSPHVARNDPSERKHDEPLAAKPSKDKQNHFETLTTPQAQTNDANTSSAQVGSSNSSVTKLQATTRAVQSSPMVNCSHEGCNRSGSAEVQRPYMGSTDTPLSAQCSMDKQNHIGTHFPPQASIPSEAPTSVAHPSLKNEDPLLVAAPLQNQRVLPLCTQEPVQLSDDGSSYIQSARSSGDQIIQTSSEVQARSATQAVDPTPKMPPTSPAPSMHSRVHHQHQSHHMHNEHCSNAGHMERATHCQPSFDNCRTHHRPITNQHFPCPQPAIYQQQVHGMMGSQPVTYQQAHGIVGSPANMGGHATYVHARPQEDMVSNNGHLHPPENSMEGFPMLSPVLPPPRNYRPPIGASSQVPKANTNYPTNALSQSESNGSTRLQQREQTPQSPYNSGAPYQMDRLEVKTAVMTTSPSPHLRARKVLARSIESQEAQFHHGTNEILDKSLAPTPLAKTKHSRYHRGGKFHDEPTYNDSRVQGQSEDMLPLNRKPRDAPSEQTLTASLKPVPRERWEHISASTPRETPLHRVRNERPGDDDVAVGKQKSAATPRETPLHRVRNERPGGNTKGSDDEVTVGKQNSAATPRETQLKLKRVRNGRPGGSTKGSDDEATVATTAITVGSEYIAGSEYSSCASSSEDDDDEEEEEATTTFTRNVMGMFENIKFPNFTNCVDSTKGVVEAVALEAERACIKAPSIPENVKQDKKKERKRRSKGRRKSTSALRTSKQKSADDDESIKKREPDGIRMSKAR